MPNVIIGDSRPPSLSSDITDKDLGYKYPHGLDLKPGSLTHSKLITELYTRQTQSSTVMKSRHGVWHELDRTLTAFVPTAILDPGKKVEKTQKTLIVPAMFALLETLLSQLVGVFLIEPYFKYRGTGSEDVIGAALLEKVIEQQCRRFKTGLAIYPALRDSLIYGFGLSVPSWAVVKGKMPIKLKKESPLDEINRSLGLPSENEYEKKLIDGTLREGNDLTTIDPYMALLDPSVPVDQIQKGEYIGWVVRTNYFDLLRKEITDEDHYFNVRYLENMDGRSRLFSDERSDKTNISRTDPINAAKPIDIISMQIKIIPKQWELGNGKDPEYWTFIIAGDSLIISAYKNEYPYDQRFQVCACAPDYDGHSAVPVSRLEVNYGMQDHVDFMFSSHMANVKRVLNDVLIIDPFMVNLEDLKHTGPGMRIRLRRRARGGDTSKAITQLKVTDVTQQHVQDAMVMIGLMEKGFGADEASQGVLRRRGERISATEAKRASLGSLTRTDKVVRIAGLQYMSDLADCYSLNTAWYTSEDTYVELTGRYEAELRREYGDTEARILVKPTDLIVQHDILNYDASSQSTEDPATLVQFLQIATQNQELFTRLDVVRLYLHAARLFGIKNAQDFERKPEPGIETNVVPNEVAMAGQATGQLTPLEIGNAFAV
uniref:Uncharacterized protein n=1 Tax=viral metagenome TaxID=1070528 RepID=A0A6M3KVK9_9ZZZZ